MEAADIQVLWKKDRGRTGRKALTNYGKLWQTMANYGKLWQTMAGQRRLWQGFDKPWQTMASYGKLWQEISGTECPKTEKALARL